MADFETVDIHAAAKFLGIKSTSRLSEKAKKGEIPAFKAGLRWMFRKDKLVEYVENLENERRKTMQVDITGSRSCQLAKRKIVLTGIRAFRSQDLECRNQLKQLLAPKPKSTKKNAERI